ncbi:MAG: hypothetical protein C3F06_04530 [Candidatus Methanoperedenaceae archaeon]|nr:MAG: hypothetical protein C3F06_04530 [Candidatus Methanoperedenaceae archaeon]
MEFYSHWDIEPDRCIILEHHLQVIGENSREIILSKQLNNLDRGVLAESSYLIGISHDFGKYTTFFQEKLKGSRDKKDTLSNHGLLSALFSYHLLSHYIKDNNLDNKKPYKFLPLLAYFIVKHHHGNLKDIENDINAENLFDSGFKNISNQLKNIETNKNQIKTEYELLLRNYNLQIENVFNNLENYKTSIVRSDDIKRLVREELDKQLYFFKKNDNQDIIYYLIVQLLFSVLIDSDKKHAGHVRAIDRKEITDNLVEIHLNKLEFKEKNTSNINNIRSQIQKSVLENISNLENVDQKIFTLTAPTGTGKTLTSFAAGLKLRKILKNHLNLKDEPRIIYSLPFTSIIDQNYSVFEEVFSQISDFREHESRYLLKHHHLSELFYKTEDIDKENDVDESLALIESWESEAIVTTFIQLFYSLIGYKNRSLKKFHNIVNSIIILDEAQNIPIEYWSLVRKVLIGMTEYFNCRIILMTATKPLIFEEGEYKELVDNYENYFKAKELNRVCLQIDLKEKQIVDFCNELNDWSKNSYLFVFNTIGSSLEFHTLINIKIQELDLPFKLYYLSTNITPKERKKRIENARKEIKNNQRIIVVSTQLIEAGVDIDCDCVYRDMGPLDSIIQVAGRCNRNKRLINAKMHLVNLINEKGRSFTNIYDPVILNIVNIIFQNGKRNNILEVDFLELIDDYFKLAKAKSGTQTKFIDSIYDLYFYDKNFDKNKRLPISEFILIREDFYKTDIFIELDDDANKVRLKYLEVLQIKNPLDRKKEFLKIKKQFYDYVISVSKNYAAYFKDKELVFVNNYELESYYDKETGFKREKAGYGNLIC